MKSQTQAQLLSLIKSSPEGMTTAQLCEASGKPMCVVSQSLSRCTGYATEPLCRSCVRYLQIERDMAQASGRMFWHVNPALANGECHNRIPFEAPQ